MFERISLNKIFKNYWGTFYDYGKFKLTGEKRALRNDYIVFLFLPLLFSLFLVCFGVNVSSEFFDLLISALAIFTGLLFNLLVLIFDTGKKENEVVKILISKIQEASDEDLNKLEEQKDNSEIKITYLKEVFAQISFAIIISIICIVFLFLSQLSLPRIYDYLVSIISKEKMEIARCLYFKLMNFCVDFCLIQFILALLVILKRLNILFKLEFKALE